MLYVAYILNDVRYQLLSIMFDINLGLLVKLHCVQKAGLLIKQPFLSPCLHIYSSPHITFLALSPSSLKKEFGSTELSFPYWNNPPIFFSAQLSELDKTHCFHLQIKSNFHFCFLIEKDAFFCAQLSLYLPPHSIPLFSTFVSFDFRTEHCCPLPWENLFFFH